MYRFQKLKPAPPSPKSRSPHPQPQIRVPQVSLLRPGLAGSSRTLQSLSTPTHAATAATKQINFLHIASWARSRLTRQAAFWRQTCLNPSTTPEPPQKPVLSTGAQRIGETPVLSLHLLLHLLLLLLLHLPLLVLRRHPERSEGPPHSSPMLCHLDQTLSLPKVTAETAVRPAHTLILSNLSKIFPTCASFEYPSLTARALPARAIRSRAASSGKYLRIFSAHSSNPVKNTASSPSTNRASCPADRSASKNPPHAAISKLLCTNSSWFECVMKLKLIRDRQIASRYAAPYNSPPVYKAFAASASSRSFHILSPEITTGNPHSLHSRVKNSGRSSYDVPINETPRSPVLIAPRPLHRKMNRRLIRRLILITSRAPRSM